MGIRLSDVHNAFSGLKPNKARVSTNSLKCAIASVFVVGYIPPEIAIKYADGH